MLLETLRDEGCVLIAFRLQSEFGPGAGYESGREEGFVLIAFRLLSEFGAKQFTVKFDDLPDESLNRLSATV